MVTRGDIKARTYREGDIRKLNAGTLARLLRGPVLVNVEAVRRPVREEVVELHVPDVARALVALNHEGLVTAVRVHIPSRKMRKCVR